MKRREPMPSWYGKNIVRNAQRRFLKQYAEREKKRADAQKQTRARKAEMEGEDAKSTGENRGCVLLRN